MTELPTNYLDDILAASMNGKRKFRITYPNGLFEEVTIEDVSEYEQIGSNFGAGDINRTNQEVNEKFDSEDVVDPMLATKQGFAADAKLTRDAIDGINSNLNMRYNAETDTVQIYYNGQWKDWKVGNMQDVYLYNYGEDNTVVTGGWVAYAYRNSGASSTAKAPTLTLNSNSMRIAISSSSWSKGAVFAENLIDLTDYTSIEVTIGGSSGFGDNDGTMYLNVATSKQNNYEYETRKGMTSIGTHTFDISSLTGSYYLCFDISATTSVYADISSIKLIK